MKIVIVDYGMGNIRSIVGAIKHLGYNNVNVSDEEYELKNANRLILPGVGNFSQAMKSIKLKRLDEMLSEIVMVDKKPILGICLGMQLLSESSTENGFNEGLGFVDGKVEKFTKKNIKVPHVGYNQINIEQNSRLYHGINQNPDYYFTHSYRLQSDSDIGQSMCSYSEEFVASFESGNISGTQFHPELSQNNGIKLLKNFVENF